MKKKPISLKDIATEFNVSISTVSRALKDSYEISPELRNRIQAFAKERNYRPSPFAMSLLKNSSGIIGIIVPDLVTYFYASIISGISDMAKQKGYSVIIASSYEQYEEEKQCLENLINIRVEGVMACISQETTDYSHFEALEELNIPLAFFDRVCLPDKFSSVVADNHESARIATEHLLQNGSKRVGFIGGADYLGIVKKRKEGYLEALQKYNIPIEDALIICEKMTSEEGCEATKRLLNLPNPPDAILAMNDTLAFAAMKEIKNNNLRIPQDIALIGYTDDTHSNYVEPALTAIAHNTYEMGTTACRLLLKQIQEGGIPEQIVVPTLLKVRNSSIKHSC